MHTGDTGGERGLEGKGARGDRRKNPGNRFAGSKSVTSLRDIAGGDLSPAQKRLIRRPRYALFVLLYIYLLHLLFL
jgi:hypothetical protein